MADQRPESPNQAATGHVNDPGSLNGASQPHSKFIPFRESKVSIAVDCSGSTYGRILEVEKDAIRQACSLIPSKLESNITVLPWNSRVGKPLSLRQLETIDSGGGTDPNVFLEDPDCRFSLQQSDCWMLFTDGMIESNLVHRFANHLADYNVHGKACIVCVFGERLEKPSDCRISVGLSVLAVSPHVAFLYADVELRKTYVLQTKGCFKSLLPDGNNPMLDYNTTWDELPDVSFENLARISIPPPVSLKKDELSLADNDVVSLQKLFEDVNISESLSKKIVGNEESMRSVALTAKARGRGRELARWLDNVDAKLQAEAPSIDGDTDSQLLKDVASRLAAPDDAVEKAAAQQALRESNARLETKVLRSESFRKSSGKSSVFFAIKRSSSSNDYDDPEINLKSSNRAALPRLPSPMLEETNSQVMGFGPDALVPQKLLLVPGFLYPKNDKERFRGACDVCDSRAHVLDLVFIEPPHSPTTENFPPTHSNSILAYPLAMGNYPETDVIWSKVVCDPCAYRLKKDKRTTDGQPVVAILPLVSYYKNKDAWLETVSLATKRRFHISQLPLVFLGILYTKLERLLTAETAKEADTICTALGWEASTLMSEEILSKESNVGEGLPGVGSLHSVVLHNFQQLIGSPDLLGLATYPLDGFIVANVALSKSRFKGHLSAEKRRRAVMVRLFYQATERYHEYERTNGKLLTQAAKSVMLQLDDPRASRSLLNWDSLRQLSIRFENHEQLMLYFRKLSKKSQYRLSLPVSDLAKSPLLSSDDLASFRRLGPLFSWIESQAGHAIAVFVHYLCRAAGTYKSPEAHFQALMRDNSIQSVIEDPAGVSARVTEELIEKLPVL